jgi:bacteriochlorophyllide a dehydrogenase
MARGSIHTKAIVLERPQHLVLSDVPLAEPGAEDIVVDIEWSSISTGTERLLYTGEMPMFPGMGYPLVPGYETVGRIVDVGPEARGKIGQRVFVPGAKCFGEIRGLFGGAASRLVVPGKRAWTIDDSLAENGALFALAATAYHALAARHARMPDLIVGHGVLGRLLARIAIVLGYAPPTVWEKSVIRSAGAEGYLVIDPSQDERRNYNAIYDVSGDAGLLNALITHLAPGGEVVLAGFYSQPLTFSFPPAFMREARLRIAAEWSPEDLFIVRDLVESGRLSLDNLITHHADATNARDAYKTAFEDEACLKMLLDWRRCS